MKLSFFCSFLFKTPIFLPKLRKNIHPWLKDVKEEAAIVMAKNLDEEIAIDVMTNNIFAGSVANNAFAFTANNFQLFLDKEHLKKRLIAEIKPGMLCHLLSQKSLMLWDKHGLYLDAVEREKQLFFFVMGYVAHDVEARIDDLKSILHVLKLPLLIHHKILNLSVMGAGLKRPPEVLAGNVESCHGKIIIDRIFRNTGRHPGSL